MKALVRKDILFPELSYKITGCVFKVYKGVGPGHLEKIYQKALAVTLAKDGLEFKEQVPCEIIYEGIKVGRGRLDFLVEDKILLELKRGNYFRPADFAQVNQYLIAKKLQLGLMIRFSADGALVKRVINTELVPKKLNNL